MKSIIISALLPISLFGFLSHASAQDSISFPQSALSSSSVSHSTNHSLADNDTANSSFPFPVGGSVRGQVSASDHASSADYVGTIQFPGISAPTVGSDVGYSMLADKGIIYRRQVTIGRPQSSAMR